MTLFAAEGGRAVLVELSVMEQRYHAVMEVISGAPVTEVAGRYGVTRQAVHVWLGKYQKEGLAGLADHSHRPHFQPRQLAADVEAMICQLRGAHPRWGPRRLQYELGKGQVAPVPSRSTIYRVLVRRGLVPARKRKRRRQDYKRWQREAPMQLWQLDITASVFLTDGTELKLISSLDDHSRYCVIATVVRRGTARAVCRAFITAMHKWAFASLRRSAWAREFYDAQRARGKNHHAALRALGNRWLEVLWHCLTKNVPYDEAVHLANRNRALAAVTSPAA
ncbi:MAG: helix-turn-helix domain-containing protein [Streptosporangiaceae bacterium]